MAWLVAPAEPFDKCFIGATAELDKVRTDRQSVLCHWLTCLQGDQLNMVLIFWYPVKSFLSIVHVYSSVNWTFTRCQKNTSMFNGSPCMRPWLPVPRFFLPIWLTWYFCPIWLSRLCCLIRLSSCLAGCQSVQFFISLSVSHVCLSFCVLSSYLLNVILLSCPICAVLSDCQSVPHFFLSMCLIMFVSFRLSWLSWLSILSFVKLSCLSRMSVWLIHPARLSMCLSCLSIFSFLSGCYIIVINKESETPTSANFVLFSELKKLEKVFSRMYKRNCSGFVSEAIGGWKTIKRMIDDSASF